MIHIKLTNAVVVGASYQRRASCLALLCFESPFPRVQGWNSICWKWHTLHGWEGTEHLPGSFSSRMFPDQLPLRLKDGSVQLSGKRCVHTDLAFTTLCITCGDVRCTPCLETFCFSCHCWKCSALVCGSTLY